MVEERGNGIKKSTSISNNSLWFFISCALLLCQQCGERNIENDKWQVVSKTANEEIRLSIAKSMAKRQIGKQFSQLV